MNEETIVGTATKYSGKIKSAIGNMTGDTGLQTQGMIDQAKGQAQDLYGSAKDVVDTIMANAPPVVRENAERTLATVRAHPMMLAAIAGTLGFVIALSLKMTSRATRYERPTS